jgi:predicted amidohydrolase
VRVAAVQHDIVWESPARNFERLAPLVAAAVHTGARLVALTEMYATGFSMAAERIAEDAEGPSAAFLAEQAQRHHVWVCGSVPTKARPSAPSALPTNSFVLAAPDGVVQRYDKLHPFSYAGEHEHYGAGELSFTFDIEGVRVTPFVCYDLRFADEWWAKAEATDLYVCVANWPAARRTHWQTLLRARAIENQAYVLGVNRVGEGLDRSGTTIDYVGDSLIIDPLGELLATAEPGVEQVITADVDPRRVADVRSSFPFLRDRRTHAVS